MNKTYHKVINGDSRDMSELRDECIHLAVTSPPYWQLKDYGTENQIGFNDTYENYINHLNLTWQECYRVLHKGGRLCINIGDQFARSVYYGRYKVIPIHSEIIKFCEMIGFDFMGSIIWQKSTTMNTSGGGSVMGSFPYPRNGIVKLDFEYILIFKKQGNAPKPTVEQKEQSKMTTDEWNTYFNGHWYIKGARQDKHLAMFPEELPKRLIKMFSFVGENILDPFLGSGTTALAAKNLGRNSVGYEINPEFIPLIDSRINSNNDLLKNNARVDFVVQALNDEGFQDRILDLPYVFEDPHQLNKKIDVKSIGFGSKIDGKERAKDEFFSVKEVVSAEKLILSNGVSVRLIGIKDSVGSEEHARLFLQTKLKNSKVFLKFDQNKYDEDNNLLAYVYLKNKTFLNAHLLKAGLVGVDVTMDFGLKNKFLNLLKAS
mgnify:CR=1 FL=1